MYFMRLRSTNEQPDEHVEKVDERELDEGSEDGHEAEDDEDVQGGGIRNLGFKLQFSMLDIFWKTVMHIGEQVLRGAIG